MAKLTVNKQNIDRDNLNNGISKDDLVNKIKDLKKELETKDSLIDTLKQQIENSSTKNELAIITNQIKNNDLLTQTDKLELLKSIFFKYQKQFFDVSNDYEDLKKDISFFLDDIKAYSGLTQIGFILIAKRLKLIRDNELYKQDGFSDFQSFFVNVLKIPKSTTYIYISIIEIFKDLFESNQLDFSIEYSKLIPFLPLLKNHKIQEAEKQEIKNNAIHLLSENTSKKDITKIAKDLKSKYKLTKEKPKVKIDKIVNSFLKKLPKDLNQEEKETIIRKIQEKI